jgi:hypothetical protein
VDEGTPGYIYYPEVPERTRETLGHELRFTISLGIRSTAPILRSGCS